MTEPDPLADVTLRPKAFFALATVAALLVGLILALLPVRVAGLDTATASTVHCGNAIGGVETRNIATALPNSGRTELLGYVDVCERAISERETAAAVLFFGGLVAALWLGVVRPRREQ